MRAARRWRELPAPERIAFALAGPLLVCFRLGVLLLPFRWVRATATLLAARWSPWRLSAARAGEIVESTARRLPGTTCLPIALAGYVLLGWTGSAPVMRMGVSKDEVGGLEAHAWVEVDGAVAVGGAERDRFHAIHDGDVVSA